MTACTENLFINTLYRTNKKLQNFQPSLSVAVMIL